MSPWRTVALLLLTLTVAGCTAPLQSVEGVARAPNLLLIITDDQRFDTVKGYMPVTWARIFQEGTQYPRAYATTPLCCPSRASVLTGLYAHRHGVRVNQDPLRIQTFVDRLHALGYVTGLVGKYLNSWDGTPRPEFDFWVSFAGGGSPYMNPRLNVNGSWGIHPGYITYILRDYALKFLQEAARQERPFLLIFTPNAPHAPALPAPGDETLYPDLPPYRPPSFNEANVSDKPEWLQRIPPMPPAAQGAVNRLRRRQLQTLKSVDRSIGEMLSLLEQQGQLENTAVFFLSDNGLFWGEHRLVSKDLAYEPSVRIPFAVRYPRLVGMGRVDSRLVANIDLAPTIYELAGVGAPPGLDGSSLVRLWKGERVWREDLLLEGWPGLAPNWAAVHTPRYVYVAYEGDIPELYDLQEDPDQLWNQAGNPAYAKVAADMKQRLARLRGKESSLGHR